MSDLPPPTAKWITNGPDDNEGLDPEDAAEEFILDDDEQAPMTESEAPEDPDQDNLDDIPDDSIVQSWLHMDSVFCVAANPVIPDMVASGSADDRAIIWNAHNGDPSSLLRGHTETVAVVAFNHDGTLLATGGLDCKINIWDSHTGDLKGTLEGPALGIDWLAWHPSGNVIVAGSSEFVEETNSSDPSVWLWDANNGQCMQVFAGHVGPVMCGYWTPDGKRVVTGGDDHSMRVWSPRNGSQLNMFSGYGFHEAPVNSIAFSPDSTIAVTGSADHSGRVCHLPTGKVLGELRGHTDSVTAVAYIPVSGDLAFAVTASLDNTICVWDSNFAMRHRLEHENAVIKLLNLSGSPFIYTASTDFTVRGWDIRDGTCLKVFRGHTDQIMDACLTCDGKKLLSCGDDKSVRVFLL